MKRRYGWHPADYEIGENEHYYEEMAQKGWILVKRGQYLSKFLKDSPRKLRYRIEISRPGFLDESRDLPAEQVDLYEECGWELAASRGLVHIFVTPGESDAPEFYQEPQDQAETLKAMRREYLWGLVPVLFYLVLDTLFILAAAGGVTWDPVVSLRVGLVRMTGVLLLFLTLMHWALYRYLYGIYRTIRLYRQLKRGVSLDHASSSRSLARRGVYALFALLSLAAGISVICQIASSRGEELSSEGPYLLLVDMGFEDMGESVYSAKRKSPVEYTESMLAKQWYVYEATGEEWMYQDIYEMRNEEAALWMAETLLEDSVFAGGEEEYQKISIEGLQAAWQTDLEFVAVLGNRVYYITYPMWESGPSPLEVLAKKEAKIH